jgi:C4-dicarboxylate-specific signal transduction histidine kinase
VLDLDVGGDTGLFCAQPVLGPDGAVLGVLALRLQGAPVVRTLQSTVAGTRLTPLLLDADGVLVYHPDTALRFATLLPLPEARAQQLLREQRFGSRPLRSLNEQALATAVRAAPRGHVGFHSATTGGEEMAGFAAVPGQPWTVVLSESRQAFEAPLRRLYQQLWWSLAGVGLLASVLGVVLARRLLRPVQALTAAAGALKRGDFDAATVAPGGHNELGRLGRTFNVMVKVLRQRRAASDAGPAP